MLGAGLLFHNGDYKRAINQHSSSYRSNPSGHRLAGPDTVMMRTMIIIILWEYTSGVIYLLDYKSLLRVGPLSDAEIFISQLCNGNFAVVGIYLRIGTNRRTRCLSIYPNTPFSSDANSCGKHMSLCHKAGNAMAVKTARWLLLPMTLILRQYGRP